MINLNKNDFWNVAKTRYPKALAVFNAWFERYRADNQWDKLFNIGFPHYSKMGWHSSPLIHDLPLAMQLGILTQFYYEQEGKTPVGGSDIREASESLEDMFKLIENRDKFL